MGKGMVAAPSDHQPKNGPLVLVIDDDRATREALRAALDLAGYQVATATNGSEALSVLTATRPSLILCDVKMPVLNGYGFLRELRTRTEFQSIPVILMSGTDRPRRLPAGCRGFFSKPLDVAMLLQLARQLCAPC